MRFEKQSVPSSGVSTKAQANLLPEGRATSGEPTAPALSNSVALLFAMAGALAVANVYYAQPLLDAMASEFGIEHASIGIVVTVCLVGYGLGLLLLVPLGDLLDRRKLIVGQSLLSVLTLIVVGSAGTAPVLLVGMFVVGFLSVVTQVLVAFAASLAAPAERGRIVGTVTSGIVLGILLARTLSGSLADLAGWRSVYFVSAVLTFLIACILFKVLPKHHGSRTSEAYPQLIRSVFSLFFQERILRVRAVISLLHFAAAMVLWTPMVLALSAEPIALSHTKIGLFGLAGAAGALGAARAGRLADRGFGQWTSGIGLSAMLISWLPTAYVEHSLWALIIGVVLFDLGLQAVHVTNQSMIYSVRPEARSRLTAGYMLFYSIGCAAGSITSTIAYAHYGWGGVCILGAAISAVALAFWVLTLEHKLSPVIAGAK